MNKILLVEDDQLLGQGLQAFLQSNGYHCTWVESAQDTEKKWINADIVILDRQLQDGDSLSHLPRWLQKKALPVIVLTAKVDIEDRIEGLMCGAKDYMIKPFSQEELLARIITHLRPIGSSAIVYKSLSIDTSMREVRDIDEQIILKPKEFQLLLLLVQNQGRVFHRDELLNKIWGYQAFPSTRTVDNHILRLRNKLPCLDIETHRGIGYRLMEHL
ncbi:response regulator transcription factor [Photobacterium angustum]|uniref:response regulator transcription factor n=1 Tax=Photobacterium angustum TaxID=661 RepID=UPI000D15AAA0|nr:response regulator transcription factor [Photobacterium angustum]PSV95098.1 DNA-binding response regulator [Photobacterium angustum]PSW80165.1 DNA-binding response regulator [Photobacterium angustum]